MSQRLSPARFSLGACQSAGLRNFTKQKSIFYLLKIGASVKILTVPIDTLALVLKSSLIVTVGIFGFANPMVCSAEPNSLSNAQALSLVKDAKPQATIVIAKEPSKTTRFAVEELNEHLELVTGAKLPVVNDEAEVKGPRVLVGESAATRALGIDTADFKHQEYLVRATADTLVLLGKEQIATDEKSSEIFVPGKWGKALSFDGKTTILDIPKAGFNDAEGTLECWVLMDRPGLGTILQVSSPPGTGLISGLRDSLSNHVTLQRWVDNSIRYLSTVDNKQSELVSKPISKGWHHVMATHSRASGKIELFIDGQSHCTAPYTPTVLGNARLYVGAVRSYSEQPTARFKGVIDEIRISKVARPAGIPSGPFESDADTALLLHCDGSPEEPTEAIEKKSKLPSRTGEIGTLYAVYDVLEKSADVRWYAPGDIGRTFEKKSDLGVRFSDRRLAPSMLSRTMSPLYLFLDVAENSFRFYETDLFMLRLRAGGSKGDVANHSFRDYYDRFSKAYGKNPARLEEDRPEFFAQGLTEEQMKAPPVAGAGGQPNLNYSSPALVEQVVKDARAQFDKAAMSTQLGGAKTSYFSMGPMDMAPWSKDPESEAASRSPRDAIDRGMRSDYWFGFVNKVARELRKSDPDNWVTALAYHDFLEYPEQAGIEPNISVTLAPRYGAPTGVWDPARKERQRRVEEGWFKHSKKSPVYMWLYYDCQSLTFGNFIYPEACAWAVPPFMRRLHDAGIRGVFNELCTETGNSYLNCQLENYLTLMLAFDATRDGEAMINEFFTKYYGTAAEPMNQLYRELEEVKFDLNNYPESVRAGTKYQNLSHELACKYLLTPERMMKWTALVDTALANAQGVHKERVQQYKTGVWDRMAAERAKFLSKSAPQSDQPAAKKPNLVPAFQAKFEDETSLQNWKLVEAGKMELSGTPMARFKGKDSLKLIPGKMVQGKPQTILQSNQIMSAPKDSKVTISLAVRGEAQGQTGQIILDCLDENGKLLKAIWKPLTISSQWNSVKFDYVLDKSTVGSSDCASIGLRILFKGEGSFYLNDLSVSKK